MSAIIAPAPARTSARVKVTDRLPFAFLGVAVIAMVKTAVNLAVLARYGWHRDELYYFASGDHPALGYVDFPPITPLLAGLSRALWHDSLVGLRSFALLAGAGVVVLAALIAAELGGRRYAQCMAAVAVAASPALLGSNAMFQTVSFDQLAWMALVLVTVRLLRSGDHRLWPLVGAVAGIGLMTKYTIAVLIGGLLLGLGLTKAGRGPLRTPWVWLGIASAAVVVVPNVWWQVRHGWPSVEFFLGQNAHVRDDTSRTAFVGELLLLAGPAALPLWTAGWIRTARDDRWRPLALAAVVVVVGYLLLGGKSYYAAPMFFPLLAAGAVALESVTHLRLRWLLVAAPLAIVATTAAASPWVLPVRDEADMVASGIWEARDDYAEELGWTELVAQVAGVYHRLPSSERSETAILTRNYGEAGAVDLFGDTYQLPRAASAHLTYGYWPLPRPHAHTLVTVGFWPEDLRQWCGSVSVVASVTNPQHVRNEELGALIAVCRLPERFGTIWPEIRHRFG